MRKDFLNWNLTNRLHNIGYDGDTLMWIDNEEDIINCDTATVFGAKPAILFSAAFRWFREKHDLFGCVDLQTCTPSHWYIRIDKIEINDYVYHSEDHDLRFEFWENAQVACIEKLCELIESGNKENLNTKI